MLRLLFTSLFIFHAMLNLIGFSKEWNISSPLQSGFGGGSRTAGTFWAIAAGLFLVAGISFLLRREWYWIPAVAGVVLSQTLIILDWSEARFGTVVNIVILVSAIFSAATMNFNRTTRKEVRDLFRSATQDDLIITRAQLDTLPAPVQRWLHNANVVGKPQPANIRIEQRGELRTKQNGRWMPFNATHYLSIDPPGFIWSAGIEAAPLVSIAGRDKYRNGRGNMIIMPLAMFTVANSTGDEIDQGTLLRYVAEMIWYPQAVASPYLSWEPVSDNEARVTMTYGEESASGVYYFDNQGNVTGFEAERYGDFEGEYRKELWSVSTRGGRSFNGVRIPDKSEVTWKLPGGDFTWLKLEVTSITPVDSGEIRE